MVALFLFSVQAEGDTLRGSKEEVVKLWGLSNLSRWLCAFCNGGYGE
ncbi:MAG: hypothetical protein ABIL50_07895 [candidate division WOR-3 bacterium]